jgi:hypothetical protein
MLRVYLRNLISYLVDHVKDYVSLVSRRFSSILKIERAITLFLNRL